MTGEAFTFVAPDEEPDLRRIEEAVGRRLPRVTLPDFDYGARSAERLEVPRAERIREIRARKAGERARAAEKAARRSAQIRGEAPPPPAARQPSGGGRGGRARRRRGGRARGPRGR
jgi:ATP-dependent RNA helicase RhlE